MNLNHKISKLEKMLCSIGQEPVVRFANSDGTYPEQVGDLREKRNVIVIYSPGVDCETLRGWAE